MPLAIPCPQCGKLPPPACDCPPLPPGPPAPSVLQLLTCDPFDLEARQMAGQHLDQNVSWSVTTRTALLEALRAGYGVGAARFDELIEEKHPETETDALRQEVTVLEDNEEATIMSFVNQIFSEAIRERATDIHIEPLENDLRILGPSGSQHRVLRHPRTCSDTADRSSARHPKGRALPAAARDHLRQR